MKSIQKLFDLFVRFFSLFLASFLLVGCKTNEWPEDLQFFPTIVNIAFLLTTVVAVVCILGGILFAIGIPVGGIWLHIYEKDPKLAKKTLKFFVICVVSIVIFYAVFATGENWQALALYLVMFCFSLVLVYMAACFVGGPFALLGWISSWLPIPFAGFFFFSLAIMMGVYAGYSTLDMLIFDKDSPLRETSRQIVPSFFLCKERNEGEWCIDGKYKLRYIGLGKPRSNYVPNYQRLVPVIEVWKIRGSKREPYFYLDSLNTDIYLNDKGLPELEMRGTTACFPPKTKENWEELLKKRRESDWPYYYMRCFDLKTQRSRRVHHLSDSEVERLKNL